MAFLTNGTDEAKRARLTQRNVFERWKLYVAHKVKARIDRHKANLFYITVLQRKVLRALIINAKRYVCDMFLNENSDRDNALRGKYFRLWPRHAYQSQNSIVPESSRIENDLYLKNISSTVEQSNKYLRSDLRKAKEHIHKILSPHYRRLLLKKCFVRWVLFRDINRRNRQIEEVAAKHYSRRLLKRYLRQLILYALKMQEKRATLAKVDEFSTKKLLFRVFSKWRIYSRRKIENANKIRVFQEKISNTMKSKIVRQWRLYVHYKKCQRRKNNMSINLRKRRLMINALKKLRVYVSYKKEKRTRLAHLNSRAVPITYRIQEIYVRKWREALGIVMLEKRKLSQAMEFCFSRLRRRYFDQWRRYCREREIKLQRKKQLHEIGLSFVQRRYISLWRGRCRDVLKFRQKEIRAVAMHRRKILEKCMRHWKMLLEDDTNENIKKNAPIEDHEDLPTLEGFNEIFQKSFQRLQERCEYHLGNVGKLQRDFDMLQKYFHKWLRVVYLKRRFKYSHSTRGRKSRCVRYPSINPALNRRKHHFAILNKPAKPRNNLRSSFHQHDSKNSTSLTDNLDQSESGVSSLDSSDFYTDNVSKRVSRDNCRDFIKTGVALLPPSAFRTLHNRNK